MILLTLEPGALLAPSHALPTSVLPPRALLRRPSAIHLFAHTPQTPRSRPPGQPDTTAYAQYCLLTGPCVPHMYCTCTAQLRDDFRVLSKRSASYSALQVGLLAAGWALFQVGA
jgi:hypothetical protein